MAQYLCGLNKSWPMFFPSLSSPLALPAKDSRRTILWECWSRSVKLQHKKMSSSGGGGVEVKRVFIGTGCNRIVNNVSWGASDLVAFGSQNALVIFSPKVPFFFFFFSSSSINYIFLLSFIFQTNCLFFWGVKCRLLRF